MAAVRVFLRFPPATFDDFAEKRRYVNSLTRQLRADLWRLRYAAPRDTGELRRVVTLAARPAATGCLVTWRAQHASFVQFREPYNGLETVREITEAWYSRELASAAFRNVLDVTIRDIESRRRAKSYRRAYSVASSIGTVVRLLFLPFRLLR